MREPMHTRLATLLATVILSSPLSAQTSRPLLSLVASYDVHVHALTRIHEQFAVGRDGRTLGTISEGSLFLCCGWKSTSFDGTAKHEVLEELLEDLAHAEVGRMPLSCVTNPALLTTGRYQLTWFGSGLRSRTIDIEVVASVETTPPCPPQVRSILSAVRDFLADGVGAFIFDVGRGVPPS
jgi:hypothetical protein